MTQTTTEAPHEKLLAAVDALRSAESWLDRWAVHVGACAAGDPSWDRCTCGLTAIRAEASAALFAIDAIAPAHVAPEAPDPDKAMIAAWTEFAPRDRPRVSHWEAFQAGWQSALSAVTASAEGFRREASRGPHDLHPTS